MITPADVASLATQVLWAAFALGVVFGAIAQRTHYCTLGALSDLFAMGDSTRLRMWVLAIGVATLGFNAMAAAGWVDAADSIYARPRLLWLADLLGGALFGFGMVLASGCGSKMLVRIGGGNLKSLVVFCVLGLAAYATLRGVGAVWRVASVDIVGALLMGFGGVTAFGCTVGQGLSGVSTLSIGSYLAVGGIVGGAWLALHYQMWRLQSGQRDP